jgi:hypothetical protein
MRILVISDIHANLTALNAVMRMPVQWMRLVPGRSGRYGPDPNEVIDRIAQPSLYRMCTWKS